MYKCARLRAIVYESDCFVKRCLKEEALMEGGECRDSCLAREREENRVYLNDTDLRAVGRLWECLD